jgi:ribosome-binding factor A
MSPDFKRTDRMNRQVAKLLSEILLRETQDPRLNKINITRVDISPDFNNAKVYYTLMMEVDNIDVALQRAQGFLRSALAKRLAMRKVPVLHFRLDEVLLKARRIEDLLNKDDSEK